MKRLFTLLVLMITLTTVSFAQTDAKMLDERKGFRKILGTEAPEDIDILERAENVIKYKRKAELNNAKVGDFLVESIEYTSYKGKVYVIEIKSNKGITSQDLLSSLEKAYGKGSKTNINGNDGYQWSGNEIKINYETIKDGIVIRYLSDSITNQKLSDEKDAATKAAAIAKAASEL
jgi:hypothetical protein